MPDLVWDPVNKRFIKRPLRQPSRQTQQQTFRQGMTQFAESIPETPGPGQQIPAYLLAGAPPAKPPPFSVADISNLPVEPPPERELAWRTKPKGAITQIPSNVLGGEELGWQTKIPWWLRDPLSLIGVGLPPRERPSTREEAGQRMVEEAITNVLMLSFPGPKGPKRIKPKVPEAKPPAAKEKGIPADLMIKQALKEGRSEPWYMTREAYVGFMGEKNAPKHLASVRQALSEGKPVPPEVLKDYPELAKVAPVIPEVRQGLSKEEISVKMRQFQEEYWKKNPPPSTDITSAKMKGKSRQQLWSEKFRKASQEYETSLISQQAEIPLAGKIIPEKGITPEVAPTAPKVEQAIDELVATARKRMAEADPQTVGLRPAETAWMTEAELVRLHELKLQLPRIGQAEAKVRAQAKRLARQEEAAALVQRESIGSVNQELGVRVPQAAKAPEIRPPEVSLAEKPPTPLERAVQPLEGAIVPPGAGKPPVEPPAVIAKPIVPGKGLPGLQDFGEAVEANVQADIARRVAGIPGLKGVAEALGGKNATAKEVWDYSLVGRRALRAEGQTKTTSVMSNLDRQGASSKVFKTGPDGAIAEGPLKGKDIDDVLTYQPRYAKDLTPEQNAWGETIRGISDDIGKAMEKEGIDYRKLSFEEGGQWIGRRVYARLTPEGELLESAFVGAGPGRPGAKAAFEKARVFANKADAVKEGFKYLPPEEALRLNIQAAYNRIADKRMADWLLKRVPWRTTAAPEALHETVAQMLKEARVPIRGNSLVNRMVRGERVQNEITALGKQDANLGSRLQGIYDGIMQKKPTADAVQTLQSELKATIKERKLAYYQAKNAVTKAREKAMRPGFEEAVIPAPAFGGKIFTGPRAKEMAEAFRKEFTPQFSDALNAVNKVNAIGRFFALAGDASPFAIQLITMAYYKPQIFGKAIGGFAQALFSENFGFKYLGKHAETIAKSRNLILTSSGNEFTEAMARGGLLRTKPLSILGKPLKPFQRAYETAVDVTGIELREALDHLATTPQRTAQVEAFVNEIRGLANSARLGVSAKQRQVETVVLLAPRYNRAIAALLTDVARGNLRGDLAREALGKTVVGIAATAVAIDLARGADWDEIVDRLNPSSSKFLTWQIAGQNIGPGSKIRSVLKLLGESAEHPDDMFKLSMENPSLRFIRGNLSPVTSTGLDLLSGENFAGDPTRENMLQVGKAVVAENMLPIWVQSMALEGGDVSGRIARGAAEFFGGRAYPMTPYQSYTAALEKVAGKKSKDISPYEEAMLVATTPSLTEMKEAVKQDAAAKGWDPESSQYWQLREEAQNERVKLLNNVAGQYGASEKLRKAIQDSGTTISGAYQQLERAFPKVISELEERRGENLEEARERGWLGTIAYYEMQNILFDPSLTDQYGEFNYDERDRRINELKQAVGPEAWQQAQNWWNLRLKDYAPEVRQYYEDQEKLKDYWNLGDTLVAKYSSETQQIWAKYQSVRGTTEGEAMRRRMPGIRELESRLRDARERYRRAHPDVDAALRTWGHLGPSKQDIRKALGQGIPAPVFTPPTPSTMQQTEALPTPTPMSKLQWDPVTKKFYKVAP